MVTLKSSLNGKAGEMLIIPLYLTSFSNVKMAKMASDFKRICVLWLCCAACRILVLRPGIKPTPPALEEWNLNCCNTKEAP